MPFPGEGEAGLAPWEYTIAELLSDAGYATSSTASGIAVIRKVGSRPIRALTSGGATASVDEAGWTSYATFDTIAKAKGIQPPQIWAGKKGGTQTAVRELNVEVRPLLDELIVEHATDYITRQAAADKPFFTYVGLSHMHPPERVHPDFDQTSPALQGQYADLIAEMDHRVGQIVDCIDQAGVAENTVIVFSSDNAAGDIPAIQGGSNGPFRGSFMTPPWEGSMRVPAMVRWPGKVPAGVVTEQMVHGQDLSVIHRCSCIRRRYVRSLSGLVSLSRLPLCDSAASHVSSAGVADPFPVKRKRIAYASGLDTDASWAELDGRRSFARTGCGVTPR